LFIRALSVSRTTGLPSKKTFGEKEIGDASPMTAELATPPAIPGSSPVLFRNLLPWIITGMPPTETDVVPPTKSELIATLGYGIGIGPPALGVLQTSGTVAIAMALLP
jgi:hypothetical protein